MKRKVSTLAKLERMKKTLKHQEPDRVPISDFFWGSFIKRWRKDLGLSDDANPYYHYDLDWTVTVPNMDPFIQPFETLKENSSEVIVKTGACWGSIPGLIIKEKYIPLYLGDSHCRPILPLPFVWPSAITNVPSGTPLVARSTALSMVEGNCS